MFLKRISAFIAGPLAAAGIVAAAAAGSASAATAAPHNGIGSAIYTTSAAGYQTQGRDFRFINTTLQVPDWFSNVLYPQEYAQLSNGSLNEFGGTTGDQYVRAGIESCTVAQALSGNNSVCSGGDWVAFVEAFNNSLNAPYWAHYVDLANVSAGDGVGFSVYFDQTGNELHFTITPPATSGPETFYKTEAFGPIFDHAAVLDDFTDSTGTPVPLPPGFNPISINKVFATALTTYSGAKGSFVGPWTTNEVIASSNGLAPPSGTVRVTPGSLTSDGIKVNGAVRPDDGYGPVKVVG